MPLPSERFLAVGYKSELGMDEEVQPGDYGSAPLRVRGVLPYQGPLGTVSGGLSLPAIRVLPVALSLLRTRLAGVSVLFAGWFGPRGLASIVLGLIVVAEAPPLAGRNEIEVVVALTVLLSVLLHGLTATPLSAAYARRVEGRAQDAPEKQEAVEASTRRGSASTLA